jgi:hypothetical protein
LHKSQVLVSDGQITSSPKYINDIPFADLLSAVPFVDTMAGLMDKIPSSRGGGSYQPMSFGKGKKLKSGKVKIVKM